MGLFKNDVFEMVYEAFQKVFPGKECVIQWVEHIYVRPGVEVWGETVFPDDGGMPVVSVSAELPVKHAAEVLAHELAHVGVGPKRNHSAKWEKAFESIHQEYMDRVEKRAGTKKFFVHVEASYADDVWVEAESEEQANELAKDLVRENLNDGKAQFVIETTPF